MLKKDYASLVDYTPKEEYILIPKSFFGISMYFVAHFQELKTAWKVEGMQIQDFPTVQSQEVMSGEELYEDEEENMVLRGQVGNHCPAASSVQS